MNYFRQPKSNPRGGKVVADILPPSEKTTRPSPVSERKKSEAPVPKPRTSLLTILPKREPRAPARQQQTHQATKTEGRHDDELPTEIELPIKTWEPEGIRRRRRIITLGAVGSLGILASAFILPLVIFPKFSVIITPKVETAELGPLTFEALTAIAAPDTQNLKMPAIRLSLEADVSDDYKSTGTRQLAERAGGTISIFNAYSSSPQTLVSGTRFRAPDGKIFRLTNSIVIPGAKIEEGKIAPQSITVAVTAAGTGESYNIGPTEFRIPGFAGGPKYDGFYGRSAEPMRGGFEGQATVSSPNDIREAEEAITARLVKKLEEDLGTKTPSDPDFMSISGARQTAITSIERPPAGTRGESFRITTKGRGELMLIRRSHLFDLIRASSLSGDTSAVLTVRQPRLSAAATAFNPDSGRMNVKISGTAGFFRKTSIEEVSNILKSSTPSKAEAYLRGQGEIASFRIKKFPAWLWFIPRRAGGVNVEVEEPQG